MSDNVLNIVRLATLLAATSFIAGCGTSEVFLADKDFSKRIYAGAGASASRLEPDTDRVAGISVDDSDSGGAGLLLGYDLNNRFSIEGHVADLGESTLAPAGSVSYTVAGLSGLFYGFNHKEARLQRKGLSAYGRLGMGILDNESEVVRVNRINDVHLLAGAGLEYGFANGLAARAELVAHETDAKYAQLALLYRFGGSGRQRGTQSTSTLPTVQGDQGDASSEADLSSQTAPDVIAAPVAVPEPLVSEPIVPSQPIVLPALVDSDQDGITDADDECADTGQGLPVNSVGCELFVGVVEGVNFLSGSADLTQNALVVLSGIAQTLQDYPDVKVTIEAHTDNMGDATANLQLSRRRALTVARYLMDEGISGARLKPQAFGESVPRQSNATAAGRTANRRVEFNVVR